MKDAPELDRLTSWEAALAKEADELRASIRAAQEKLAEVEERLTLVGRLVQIEMRAQSSDSGRPSTSQETRQRASLASEATPWTAPVPDGSLELEDAVEAILREAAGPLHISAIRKALVEGGVPIPGRGDDANIIVRLRRFDRRFTRTARGTYALAEWGLPALPGPRRRRKGSSK